MIILVKPGWEFKVSVIKLKVYPLGNKARRVVDDIFDKKNKQGHLKYITNLICFRFLIFVIHKIDSQGKKKGCAIIDI